MHSKRGLLRAFRGVRDEKLKELISRLIQTGAEHADSPTAPLAHYRRAIESFADEYGDELDPTFVEAHVASEDTEADSRSVVTSRPFITLERLTLENFGSYCGTATIELAPVGPKNVTAIVGSNGDGKTTLFMALNWALFGAAYLTELEASHGKTLSDLVNRAAVISGVDSAKQFDLSVTLWFSIDSVQYYLTRTVGILAQKQGAGITVTTNPLPNRLRKIDSAGNHQELLEGAILSLLSQLPARVRDFYLFDGEQINQFVAPGAQRAVRSAIRRVVGIESLEKTAEQLRKVSQGFRSEARRLASGNLARIQGELSNKADEKANLEEKIETHRQEIIGHQSKISEIEALLAKSKDTRPLQESRDHYTELTSQYREEEENLVFRIRELACHASTLLAGTAVGQLIEDLDRKRDTGAIPGPIGKQLMKDLLKLEECICGTPIPVGSAARTRLEERLKSLVAQSTHGEFQLGLFYELSTTSKWVIDKATELDKSRSMLVKTREKLVDAKSKLDHISEQLAGIEIVDRAGWESERKARDTKRIEAQVKLLNAEDRIRVLGNEIERLKNEEKREKAGQEEAAIMATRANWSEAAESNIRNVFNAFAADARQDIERETTRLWKAMLPNVEAYSVVVSEDFELAARDGLGRPAMQDLAMGQQQCLGLAFIMAVARVAESKPPLVIDMPFGRLGADTAQNVASKLPELTEQLILFVLPGTEWNPEIRKAVGPALAREYFIKYDAVTQTSRFISGNLEAS